MLEQTTRVDAVAAVPSRRKRILKLAGLAAILSAPLLGWKVLDRDEPVQYTTAAVERGDIVKNISATGKLQAVVTVQVGSQVSGRISQLYADFNSLVKKGQIIARLDPSLFQAQLDQARGNLANAQARLRTAQNAVANAQASLSAAQANRNRLQAARDDAQRAHGRMDDILNTGAVSEREVEAAAATVAQSSAQLEQANAQVEQAQAQLLSAQSQVDEAKAQVQQTQASVNLATANLGYTVIRAPIDGVVIARNVDVGQTVAASLQAPTLFLIANDLTQMQVLADIDEADVGQLSVDNKVTFAVDAYPRDVFEGRVAQIRLNPQTVQNVVTYTAVVDVSNPELKLKPGMTANVTATVAETRNVLTVPNAALRFRPETATAEAGRERGQAVWKTDAKGKLERVAVKTVVTDGSRSEIVAEALNPGDMIITGQTTRTASVNAPAARNPMMPAGPRGGRR
jgi:HlyD family secretion protein